MEPILLIRNQKSGISSHDEGIERGIVLLAERGFKVVTVALQDILTKEAFEEQIVRHKPLTVIATGGDGTVNLLAQYLVDTELRLAVVPAGTFNHFARHIGIGTDIEAAFETVTEGETIIIDAAEVNGRIFVNFSCVGFYTELIKRRVSYQKRAWQKWSAFAISLYEILVNHGILRLSMYKNDAEVKIDTPLVFVGNNIFNFGGPDILSGRESFTSGKLQVSVAGSMRRWGIFLLLLRSLFSDTKHGAGFTTVALDEIEIDSRKQFMWVSLDGEIAKFKAPLRYKIRPQSLRVIVPRHTHEENRE